MNTEATNWRERDETGAFPPVHQNEVIVVKFVDGTELTGRANQFDLAPRVALGPTDAVAYKLRNPLPSAGFTRYTAVEIPTILDEAAKLTSQDRQAVYGHPADDYARTAAMWSAYLGVEVTALQAQMCMVLVKVSRLANTPTHRDSLVDIAGYARTYEMTLEKQS